MSRNAVTVGVVILVLIIGGWFLTRPKQTALPTQPIQTPSPTESATPPASEGAKMAEEKDRVTITQSGFSPKDITISVGETVNWMNEDTVDHAVNSAVHPTHLLYPPLNLGTIKAGDKKSLTFPTAGTYKYHDHLNPSLTGSVTVQ